MNRKLILAMIVLGATLAIAEVAVCYNCLATPCYNKSACLPGCSCVVAAGDDATGVCVGIY